MFQKQAICWLSYRIYLELGIYGLWDAMGIFNVHQ